MRRTLKRSLSNPAPMAVISARPATLNWSPTAAKASLRLTSVRLTRGEPADKGMVSE